VELLTVGLSDDAYHNKAIITAYANLNGHAEKYCEGAIDFTYLLSICGSDGRPLFKHDTYGNVMETHEFYKIENGTLELDEKIEIYYGGDAVPEEVDKAFETYEAILQKFTDEKELIKRDYSSGIVSISNRGLVPSREEYEAALAKQWEAERDKIYAAVKNGDFSYFAGNYSAWGGNLVLSKDGIATGDGITSRKPISITVTEGGAIECVVKKEEPDWESYEQIYEESYLICPVGVKYEYFDSQTDWVLTDSSKVRILYIWRNANTSGARALYYKVS